MADVIRRGATGRNLCQSVAQHGKCHHGGLSQHLGPWTERWYNKELIGDPYGNVAMSLTQYKCWDVTGYVPKSSEAVQGAEHEPADRTGLAQCSYAL